MNGSSITTRVRTVLVAIGLTLVVAPIAGSVGDAARQVSLVDTSGGSVPFGRLVDAAIEDGARVQLVLFWSLYEPQSRRSLRALDLYLGSGDSDDDIVAIGIAVPEYREGPDAIEEFAGKARVTLPIYLDPLGRLVGALTREASSVSPSPSPTFSRTPREPRVDLPITVVIGPDGGVSGVLTGENAATVEALDAAIVFAKSAAARGRNAGDRAP